MAKQPYRFLPILFLAATGSLVSYEEISKKIVALQHIVFGTSTLTKNSLAPPQKASGNSQAPPSHSSYIDIQLKFIPMPPLLPRKYAWVPKVGSPLILEKASPQNIFLGGSNGGHNSNANMIIEVFPSKRPIKYRQPNSSHPTVNEKGPIHDEVEPLDIEDEHYEAVALAHYRDVRAEEEQLRKERERLKEKEQQRKLEKKKKRQEELRRAEEARLKAVSDERERLRLEAERLRKDEERRREEENRKRVEEERKRREEELRRAGETRLKAEADERERLRLDAERRVRKEALRLEEQRLKRTEQERKRREEELRRAEETRLKAAADEREHLRLEAERLRKDEERRREEENRKRVEEKRKRREEEFRREEEKHKRDEEERKCQEELRHTDERLLHQEHEEEILSLTEVSISEFLKQDESTIGTQLFDASQREEYKGILFRHTNNSSPELEKTKIQDLSLANMQFKLRFSLESFVTCMLSELQNVITSQQENLHTLKKKEASLKLESNQKIQEVERRKTCLQGELKLHQQALRNMATSIKAHQETIDELSTKLNDILFQELSNKFVQLKELLIRHQHDSKEKLFLIQNQMHLRSTESEEIASTIYHMKLKLSYISELNKLQEKQEKSFNEIQKRMVDIISQMLESALINQEKDTLWPLLCRQFDNLQLGFLSPEVQKVPKYEDIKAASYTLLQGLLLGNSSTIEKQLKEARDTCLSLLPFLQEDDHLFVGLGNFFNFKKEEKDVEAGLKELQLKMKFKINNAEDIERKIAELNQRQIELKAEQLRLQAEEEGKREYLSTLMRKIEQVYEQDGPKNPEDLFSLGKFLPGSVFIPTKKHLEGLFKEIKETSHNLDEAEKLFASQQIRQQQLIQEEQRVQEELKQFEYTAQHLTARFEKKLAPILEKEVNAKQGIARNRETVILLTTFSQRIYDEDPLELEKEFSSYGTFAFLKQSYSEWKSKAIDEELRAQEGMLQMHSPTSTLKERAQNEDVESPILLSKKGNGALKEKYSHI